MALLIGIAGICLRLGLLFTSLSLWGDEWESVLSSKGDWARVIITQTMDTHPPLYFLMLNAAGTAGRWQEWALRLPSLTAGIGAIFGIYFFSKEYFDKKTALAALFFAALSPYLIHLSFELRNHGPALVFTSWGSFFLLKMLREPEKRGWGYAYAVSAALAIWTTHFAWFWAASCLLFHAAETRMRRYALAGWFFQVFFLSACLPMLALFAWHGSHEAFSWKTSVFSATPKIFYTIKYSVGVFWHMLTGPVFLVIDVSTSKLIRNIAADPFLTLSMILAVTATSIGIARTIRNARCGDFRLAWLLGAVTIPVAVIALCDPGRLDTRYFALETVFFTAFMAHSWQNIGWPALKKTVAVLSIVVWISGIIFIYRSPTDPFNRENYFDLARYLAVHGRPGDISYCKSTVVRYYLKKMGLKSPILFSDDQETRPAALRNKSRIWVLEGAAVGTPYFEVMRKDFERFGFKPAGREIYFGERMLINRFDRDTS